MSDFDRIAREISGRHALDYLSLLDAQEERRAASERREAEVRAAAAERFGARLARRRDARFLARKQAQRRAQSNPTVETAMSSKNRAARIEREIARESTPTPNVVTWRPSIPDITPQPISMDRRLRGGRVIVTNRREG
jgi:hypothetical protein